MIKLIIAGGEHHEWTEEDRDRLDQIHHEHGVRQILVGTLLGASFGGLLWAEKHQIITTFWNDDLERYGDLAESIKNSNMVHNADAIALFPPEEEIASIRKAAHAAGIMIFDFSS